jgi:hypothetical protein
MITQTTTAILSSELCDDLDDCSPEEQAILSRFAGRTRRALIDALDSLGDGTFLIF